jgi:hypothetical protein
MTDEKNDPKKPEVDDGKEWIATPPPTGANINDPVVNKGMTDWKRTEREKEKKG